jgi:hypothetical protein
MKKNWTYIAFAVGTLVLAFAGHKIYKYIKGKNDGNDTPDEKIPDVKDEPVTPSSKPASQLKPSSPYPLKKGSQGVNVMMLQARLNYVADAKLSPFGYFGGLTEAAVKNYFKDSSFFGTEVSVTWNQNNELAKAVQKRVNNILQARKDKLYGSANMKTYEEYLKSTNYWTVIKNYK